MILKSLRVAQLRAFEQAEFEFDPKFTLLVGINGVGKTTVLGLAHPSLCEDRRRVLNEFIFGPSGQEPLPAAKAKQAMGAICQPGTNGHFFEFCIAIRDALAAHLKYLDKLAKKKKAIRRKN